MDFIYSTMAIWMLIVWIVGALVITGFLIVLALGIYDRLSSNWAKGLCSHVGTQIWLFRAIRSYERAGNLRPKALNLHDDEDAIKQMLAQVVHAAKAQGYVITVENKPLTPLDMGNTRMVYDVRPARNHEGGTK